MGDDQLGIYQYMTEELNEFLPRNKCNLVVRTARHDPMTIVFQVWGPKHSATLPS